jgi:hypothetical protein
MTTLLKDLFSRKNINLFVGAFTLLIFSWLILFFVPTLFVTLFDTGLGNLILIAFLLLVAMYNTNLAIGLTIMLIILWRSSRIII